MYYPNDIEEICYEQDHIEQVWDEMKQSITIYFQQYIDTEGGHSINDSEAEKLAEKFGSTSKPKNKVKDGKKILERLLKETIADFEKERQPYLDILDLESLEEYKHDVNSFKNTVLKNQIPIIRKTLQNKQAKELDKFRVAFNNAQPGHLFEVSSNIVKLANEWRNDWYDAKAFENIDTVTLYVGPQNQPEYYQYIGDLNPRRVIFNPGTENPEFISQLKASGIYTEIACTLVLLATGHYE